MLVRYPSNFAKSCHLDLLLSVLHVHVLVTCDNAVLRTKKTYFPRPGTSSSDSIRCINSESSVKVEFVHMDSLHVSAHSIRLMIFMGEVVSLSNTNPSVQTVPLQNALVRGLVVPELCLAPNVKTCVLNISCSNL